MVVSNKRGSILLSFSGWSKQSIWEVGRCKGLKKDMEINKKDFCFFSSLFCFIAKGGFQINVEICFISAIKGYYADTWRSLENMVNEIIL